MAEARMGYSAAYYSYYDLGVMFDTPVLNTNVQVEAMYQSGAPSATAQDESVTLTELTCPLNTETNRTLMQGGLMLKQGSDVIVDRAGKLVKNPSLETGAGTDVGTIDYGSAVAKITNWTAGNSALSVESVLLSSAVGAVRGVIFKTEQSPLRSGSVTVNAVTLKGEALSVKSDNAGALTSDKLNGVVRDDIGVIELQFTEPVLISSVKYNGVAISYLPIDAAITRIDSTRLPIDGRVPIFRTGGYHVISHEAVTEIASPQANQVIDLGRTRLSYANVRDSNGVQVNASMWSVDLDAGQLKLKSTFTATGYDLPLKATHMIEDMRLCNDVQITNEVTHTLPLSHDFPAGSVLSSALVVGDMQARVVNLFDQSTWQNKWLDIREGSEPEAEYNAVTYPVIVKNKGAIEEDWALIFKSSTTVAVVGKSVGQLGVYPISADIAPLNPNFGVPYFTVPAGGWGSGWSAGNVVRFKTLSTSAPFQLLRCTLQADAVTGNDDFKVCLRANVNA